MGTNSISFGEYSANSRANTLERQAVKPLKLVVTAIITGYTCQFIYGQRLKNSAIVVPVYRLDVLANNKSIASYNVTRDSWYNRGRIESNFFSPDKYELSNRCFEPADANLNLYSTTPLSYPTSDLDAYALRQKGSELLNAVAHTAKMNTYVDGQDIDDARANLSIAKGVMIHIGGWYNKGGKKSLAGSYGCFGIISSYQIKKTKAEAEQDRDSKNYEKFTVANDAYKAAIQFIINNSPKGTTPQVLIKKRSSVEQLRIIEDK